jgi:hypothetical protein
LKGSIKEVVFLLSIFLTVPFKGRDLSVMLMISLLAFYDVITIKLSLKEKMILDAENPLRLERHKAKGAKRLTSC